MANIGEALMKLGCGMTLLVWVGLPMTVVAVVAVMVFPPLLILPIGAFVVWLFAWAIGKGRRRMRAAAESKYETLYTTLQEGMTLEEVRAIMGSEGRILELEEVRAIMGSEGETLEDLDGLLVVNWFVEWYDGGLVHKGFDTWFTVGPDGPVLMGKSHRGTFRAGRAFRAGRE